MTDTGSTEYDEMDKEQLKDEARARGLATSGSKAALRARLTGGEEPDDDGIDDDDDDGIVADREGMRTVESNERGGVRAPYPPAVGDDYKAPPEPADVAGMASPGAAFDSRAVAHQAQLRNDAKYHNEGGLPAEQARAMEAADTGEFDDANGEFPNEGYTESTLPVGNRADRRFNEWRDANPDATVIPPTLLPPAYQDPTIATPGLPGDLDDRAGDTGTVTDSGEGDFEPTNDQFEAEPSETV